MKKLNNYLYTYKNSSFLYNNLPLAKEDISFIFLMCIYGALGFGYGVYDYFSGEPKVEEYTLDLPDSQIAKIIQLLEETNRQFKENEEIHKQVAEAAVTNVFRGVILAGVLFLGYGAAHVVLKIISK